MRSPVRHATAAVALVALLSAPLAACHSRVRVPILGAGPFGPNDPALLDGSIRVLARLGYAAQGVDRAHGYFQVVPHGDPFGEMRFDVQCFSHGWVTVTPVGPNAERIDGSHVDVPRTLRAEYAQLAASLERGLVEVLQ